MTSEAGMGGSAEGSPPRHGMDRDAWIGRVVKGRYRILRRLATDPTGRLYLASLPGREPPIALKVFHRELVCDAESVKRWRERAERVAYLSREQGCIATVYDCDQMEDGRIFLAMEHLQGRSLAELLRAGSPLAVRPTLRLAQRIAEGLEAAHARGIIHGDLRPSNVMVPEGRAGDAIRLLGFEGACWRESGAGDALIGLGRIADGPEYSAPEQIEGGEITARTDIYAFGVLLYAMLSGKVPFTAATPDAVLAKHLQDTPVRLGRLRGGIPAPLEQNVMQALQKEPECRQTHIGDVVNAFVCEAAREELDWVERLAARGKLGRIWNLSLARAEELKDRITQDDRLKSEWRVYAVSGAVIVALWIAAFSSWMLWPKSIREHAAPSALQSAVIAPAPSASREEMRVPVQNIKKPAAPAIALRPAKAAAPEQSHRSKAEPLGKRQTRPSRPRKSEATSGLQEKSPSQPLEAPKAAADAPDPSDVIDWVLQRK